MMSESPCLEIAFSFFPTPWAAGVSRQVFTALVGADKLFPARSWGNEGKQELPQGGDGAIKFLTDHYEAQSTGNRIPLFTKPQQANYSFNLIRSEWGQQVALGASTFWAKRLTMRIPHDGLDLTSLDVLAEIAELTNAALVTIDFKDHWRDTSVTQASHAQLKRIVQGTVHAKAVYGPWRGLAPVPWRAILGRDIVASIDPQSLQELGDATARDHGNGLWTLETSPDPSDSITPTGREAAQSIVTSLGTELFVDIGANKLATCPPQFPSTVVPDDTRLIDRYGEVLKPL